VVRLISRAALGTFICLSLIALTLPMRAAPAPPQPKRNCCGHAPTQDAQKHCHHQQQQSTEGHCCAACPIGLSLFLTPPSRLIFSRERGEQLVADSSAQMARFERPPVPPPRAALGSRIGSVA
jgi:hypothetical protein